MCLPPAHGYAALQVVLREPFAGCTLFEVALFLRCAYRPADLTSANLDAVRGSLLGLLRLADQLDAPGVMHALAVYMRGELCACKSGSGVGWVQGAASLHWVWDSAQWAWHWLQAPAITHLRPTRNCRLCGRRRSTGRAA